MRNFIPLLATSFLLGIGVTSAIAASSQWSETQGGSVRFVTAGKPDADGMLRGALQVDLKPGWKTYWRDPGDSGVPPQISLSGASLDGISFPAPQRFEEGGSSLTGYEAPISFAVRMKPANAGDPGEITANVFLGICQSICIPLQAKLTVDAGADADNSADGAIVSQAFDALPAPAKAGFRVASAERGEKSFTVEAELPDPAAKATLFVAAPEGYSFGAPKRQKDRDGKAAYSVPIYDQPDGPARSASVRYTLVQGTNAVDGAVHLP